MSISTSLSYARRLNRRFRDREDGGVTVEAAIWLPFWILFMFGIGEVALLFNGQAAALDVTQDVLRSYAIGDISSEAEIKARIVKAMSNISGNVSVYFFMADGMATASVTVPARDLSGGFGIFSAMSGFDVTITTQQMREI